MKPVKAILAFVLGALYASSLWLGALCWPLPVVLLPIVLTLALLTFSGAWLAEHWND